MIEPAVQDEANQAAGAASLDRLHDIVLPDPVPWWPPATGWYFVVAVLLLGLVLLAWRFWRAWKRDAYRRAALAELERLEGEGTEELAALPALLKRTALVAYDRSEVAALSGDAWLEFLDAKGETAQFTKGPGKFLPELSFRPGAAAELDEERTRQLLAIARDWIEHHRPGMLTLDHPWLLALALLPLLLRWGLPAYRERRVAVAVPNILRLSRLTGREPGTGAVVLRSTLFQNITLWIVWLGLVTAFARPQLVEDPLLKTVPTRDLLLAIDLSGSMEATDFTNREGEQVDRLTAVKEVLDDFLARREGDRVGLIVFGTAAFVQVPFTEDLDVCRQLLDELQVRMAGPRTAMGDAIGLALTVFERSDIEERVLIVLTDGNDTSSKVPPDKAAQIARDEGITIHTIAVGDPQSVGEEKIDEDALHEVATATGGDFFRASDREELSAIYTQLDEIGAREVETISHRPTRDLFHWPLGTVFLLALAYHALRNLRPNRRQVAVAAALLALVTLTSASSPVARSEFHFLRPVWLVALVPLVLIGYAAHRQGDAIRSLGKHFDEHLIQALLVGSDRRGSVRPGPVLFGSGILATLALAGPAWQREPAPFTEDSAAVVVAIEVTPTMLAQDVQPSRLERASHKVRDLLALRPGARAGLVAFAGSAHTVMPLTADAEIVSTFAAELVPAIMPEEGEATGKAIALANRMLREADVPGSILLVTDGVPPDQLAALEEKRREGGVPVHLLVVAGDDGAYVPPGSPPAPALDRTAGERAASAAGGSLTVVSADDRDVERLANKVETSFAAVSDGGERWRDSGYWFLPLLLLGALLWFRPGWRVSNG